MRSIVFIASLASMLFLQSIPGQAVPVVSTVGSEASGMLITVACSHRNGCRARRATIVSGRIVQKGCNKKIGPGLRTPC